MKPDQYHFPAPSDRALLKRIINTAIEQYGSKEQDVYRLRFDGNVVTDISTPEGPAILRNRYESSGMHGGPLDPQGIYDRMITRLEKAGYLQQGDISFGNDEDGETLEISAGGMQGLQSALSYIQEKAGWRQSQSSATAHR